MQVSSAFFGSYGAKLVCSTFGLSPTAFGKTRESLSSLQYLIVLWQGWHYKNSKAPLALVTAPNFVAALVLPCNILWVQIEHPSN